ncbi:unnamed protein product [Closterium sp. NIES-64]|nr:unnamed protein product [Closterium sp. NIES-64]
MFHGPTHSHGKVREDEKVVRGSERTGIMCDPRLSLRTLLVPLPRPPLRFPRPPVRQWGMPTDLAAVALLAQATFEATQKSHGSRGSTGAGGGRLSIQRGGLQLRDTVNAVIRQRRAGSMRPSCVCVRSGSPHLLSFPPCSALSPASPTLSPPLPPSPPLSPPLPPLPPSPPLSPPSSPLFPPRRQRRFNEAITCLRPQQRFSQLLEEMKVLGCGPRLGGAGGGGVEPGGAGQGEEGHEGAFERENGQGG